MRFSASAIDSWMRSEMERACQHPRCAPHPDRCEYASRTGDPVARFWSKVNMDGPVLRPDLGPCWIWTGAINNKGYGRFSPDSVTDLAHRFGYELQCGPLSADDDICHHCDNPPCVRGSHLFKGNAHLNALDMMAKGRNSVAVHPECILRGERTGQAKLRESQVIEIKARIARGEGCQRISEDYPVTRAAITLIKMGRNWRHVP